MSTITLKDRTTFGQMNITADQIVKVQNITGGILDIHDLDNEKDPSKRQPITFKKDEIKDLTDYELTPQAMRRSTGLVFAIESGKLAILKIKDANGQIIQVSKPTKAGVIYDKKAQRSMVGDNLEDPKALFDLRLRLVRLRERREELETRQGYEPSEEEALIMDGTAEQKLLAEIEVEEQKVKGMAPTATPGLKIVSRAEVESRRPEPSTAPAAAAREGMSVAPAGTIVRDGDRTNPQGVDAGSDPEPALDQKVPGQRGKNQGEGKKAAKGTPPAAAPAAPAAQQDW